MIRKLTALVGLVAVSVGSAPGIALAAPGSKLWASRYDATGTSYESAADIGVSPDGSTVFVTGRSVESVIEGDYITVAYDAVIGTELWVARYDGPEHLDDRATAISVSPDGSAVFVTGSSAGSTPYTDDYATVAYDASTGTKLWVGRYDSPTRGDDDATALAVSADGSAVFVTGGSFGSSRFDDYATVAYGASDGLELWVKRYDSPEHQFDAAKDIGVSADGSVVFVTGQSTGATNNDYGTVAYDATTGSRLWVKHYSGRRTDIARALAVSPDGSALFVTGGSVRHTRGGDFVTVAYEPSTGAKLWSRRYDYTRSDYAIAVEVSPDGSVVFVTGPSVRPTSGRDYATVAYDAATGATLWTSRYEGNQGDAATALGLSPDGSTVFVTGVSERSTSDSDLATVAYDAVTGAEVWVKRYNGTGNGYDHVNALAVDPNGSAVFVAGVTVRSTGYDSVTLAYSVT